MKSLICALVILFSVILTTVLCSIYTDKFLADFSNEIDKVPDNLEYETQYIGDVEKRYKDIKLFLILFMRENDVKEIELYIEDIKTAANKNDATALAEAKGRLKLHIRQLRRLSAFSIEAIF